VNDDALAKLHIRCNTAELSHNGAPLCVRSQGCQRR
jgi:hypothetical protein